MPSGVGNVFVLPKAIQTWQDLTSVGGGGKFGSNPMGSLNNTINWGLLGGWTPRGPQSTQYQDPGLPLGDPNGVGMRGALFGGGGFGQGAYGRFQDVDRPAGTLGPNDPGGSYQRRYATDAVDPVTGRVLIESPERSAGQRSGALFGGRGEQGQPIFGSQYDTSRNFAGLATLQQGANPWLNNPTLAAQMSQYQELNSPFARADPRQWLQTAQSAETGPSTGDLGNSYIGQMGGIAGGAVPVMQDAMGQQYGNVMGDVKGVTNSYEKQLLDQIAQQGSKDLSLGLQDAQNTMASMGLGRSGQGAGTAAGVWSDIQSKNALDRSNIMAQFRQAAMDREANAATSLGQTGMQNIGNAIGQAQQGNINSVLAAQQMAGQGNEARLGRANQAAMGGLQALTGSLEGSRAAERQALGGGMDRTAQWNQSTQGNYLQSLLGGDQAALNRLIAESQGQSLGLHDYMGLQQTRDQMYNDRLNQMLGLEGGYTSNIGNTMNQMQYYGMLPHNDMFSMLTGLPQSAGSPSQPNPWMGLLTGAGANMAGSYLGQMNQVPQANPMSAYQSTYDYDRQ